MSDVLSRLRAVQNESQQYASGSDIMRDAADEIEALRAQLSEAQARLAEIEKQEPVCVIEVKNGDGALIAGSLDRGTHKLYAAPAAQAAQPVADDVVRAAWIDPTDRTQQRFLPDIGEPVLFCHGGRTFYGKHTGGSFMSLVAPNIGQTYRTWECRWMYPPAALLAAQQQKAGGAE